ncbi:MAG: hypothetical protein AAFY29_22855 [Pseudomonadota bacterium]
MSDVLGYDCDGKPVRVGDWVQVAKPISHTELTGKICRVVGVDPLKSEQVELDLEPIEPSHAWYALPAELRVVNDDTGSWDHIEQILQWQRPKVDEDVTA